MTTTDRDYREALTRMSNGDLLRAYGQAVLDNDGPGSRGFFQQQSIASELLRRMEPCGRQWMIGDRVQYTSRYVGRGEVIDPVAGTVTAITDDGVLVQWDDGTDWVELRADQLVAAEKRKGADKPDEICTVRDCPGFGTRHGPMEY